MVEKLVEGAPGWNRFLALTWGLGSSDAAIAAQENGGPFPFLSAGTVECHCVYNNVPFYTSVTDLNI